MRAKLMKCIIVWAAPIFFIIGTTYATDVFITNKCKASISFVINDPSGSVYDGTYGPFKTAHGGQFFFDESDTYHVYLKSNQKVTCSVIPNYMKPRDIGCVTFSDDSSGACTTCKVQTDRTLCGSSNNSIDYRGIVKAKKGDKEN